MRLLRELQNNPFFQSELRRQRLRAAALLLLLVNAAYVALFLGARVAQDLLSGGGSAHRLAAEFDYRPWLLVGAGLLSLCVHWLVPPLMVRAAGDRYDLRSLALMVGGRRTGEEWWRGRLAARLAPTALGAFPLSLGLPVLALYAPQLGHPAAAVLVGGLIWAALCAGVSLWLGLRCPPRRASLCAYGLTSFALPFLIGAVASMLAWGCSNGRPDQHVVFPGVAALTWNLLALGIAAAFWDRAVEGLFPDRRAPLWQELGPGAGSGEDDD